VRWTGGRPRGLCQAAYTRILPAARDEASLARVLGREVAHVLARHSAERISRQLSLQLGAEWLGSAAGVELPG
jgi:predicted Zn-dependent protease